MIERTDGQLLDRFLSQHEEAAFQELLKRHGSMVMGVCRRILVNEQDAEDAFQTTFLILSKKASSMKNWNTVAGWLYRVAFRSALKLKRKEIARNQREIPMEEEPTLGISDSSEAKVWEEIRPILDEEIDRLSERYRLPIVLCYLEGRSYEETALQLKVPHGTIRTRLERARDLLRDRLVRRGVILSNLTLGTLLTENANAVVSVTLASSTTRAATDLGAGNVAIEGMISPNVPVLMKETGKALFMKKMTARFIAVVILVLGVNIGMKYWGEKAASVGNHSLRENDGKETSIASVNDFTKESQDLQLKTIKTAVEKREKVEREDVQSKPSATSEVSEEDIRNLGRLMAELYILSEKFPDGPPGPESEKHPEWINAYHPVKLKFITFFKDFVKKPGWNKSARDFSATEFAQLNSTIISEVLSLNPGQVLSLESLLQGFYQEVNHRGLRYDQMPAQNSSELSQWEDSRKQLAAQTVAALQNFLEPEKRERFQALFGNNILEIKVPADMEAIVTKLQEEVIDPLDEQERASEK